MLRAWTIASALLLSSIAAVAQSSGEDDLSSFVMQGTIGHLVVGLNYTVRNKTDLVTAHYYYASQLTNIGLNGKVQGEEVLFQGDDGSRFRLHFVGNGSNGNDPLTFYNSIGLNGTWMLGTRSLPVTLDIGYGTANPGERLYDQVTSKTDAEFEHMVQVTRKAILNGDVDQVSTHIDFPLTVNLVHRSLKIRNPDQMKKKWSIAFPPSLIAKLRKEIPHEMFVHEGEAMLGPGDLWFDESGLSVVNQE